MVWGRFPMVMGFFMMSIIVFIDLGSVNGTKNSRNRNEENPMREALFPRFPFFDGYPLMEMTNTLQP